MASSKDSYIGRQMGGDYRIVARVSRGSFGTVYTARHIVFEDEPVVAIKILSSVVETEAEQQAFFQEARPQT